MTVDERGGGERETGRERGREGREGGRGEREQVTCGGNSDIQRAGVIYIMDRVKEERPAEGEESRCEKERGTV